MTIQSYEGGRLAVVANEWRILYAGTGLAGVSTSIRFLAHTSGVELPRNHRYAFETERHDAGRLTIASDVRTPYFFESAASGLAKCEGSSEDSQIKHLAPLFRAHLEFLKAMHGVVFVVDIQPERSEANAECLRRLKMDLGAIGRSLAEVSLVFQCNKRDLPNQMPMSQLEDELHWPQSTYTSSCATTGEGVVDALRTLLAMFSRHPQYR